jgi:sugar lactone lactonase YvrE
MSVCRDDSPAGGGRVVVADSTNHALRAVAFDASGGAVVTTLAGTGEIGSRNGPGAKATLNSPFGVRAAADGTVYFTEGGGHRVRKVRPDGVVLLVAGKGTLGWTDGAKALCQFNSPHGLAVDPRSEGAAAGPKLVVADTNNHVIRVVDAATGATTTLAGRGPQFAGFKDGKGARCQFAAPSDVAVAPCGTVFVADMFNHRIRTIMHAPDGSGARVATLAGTGEAGRVDGPVGVATLDHPNGLFLDLERKVLFFTEMKGQAVRAIDVAPVLAMTAALAAGMPMPPGMMG